MNINRDELRQILDIARQLSGEMLAVAMTVLEYEQERRVAEAEPVLAGYNAPVPSDEKLSPTPASKKARKTSPKKGAAENKKTAGVKRSKLTPTDLERIRKRYERGDAPADIAKPFGVSGQAIEYHARTKGWSRDGTLPPDEGPTDRAEPESDEPARSPAKMGRIQLYKCSQGHSFRSITEKDTCAVPHCGATAWPVGDDGQAL